MAYAGLNTQISNSFDHLRIWPFVTGGPN